MTTKTYTRDRDNFDTAAEAWNDIEARSELVDDFSQYVERDHTGAEWRFVVEVEE